MLERQLEFCKDPLQRLRILVPSRFGLRAEHVCSDLIRKDGIPRFLKCSHIKFGFNKHNNPISASIVTGRDKNHDSLKELHRHVYCSCGLDNFSCVVHELYAYLNGAVSLPPDDCLLRNDDNSPLSYRFYNSFARKMAIMIGLPPRFYTSHAYRKGALTELSLGGTKLLDLVDFGKWGDVSAMKTYVKLDNPDLKKFYDVPAYRRFRNKQGNPGFETAVNFSVSEYLLAFKQKKRKESITTKRRKKLKSIEYINKAALNSKVDSKSVSLDLISKSGKLEIDSDQNSDSSSSSLIVDTKKNVAVIDNITNPKINITAKHLRFLNNNEIMPSASHGYSTRTRGKTKIESILSLDPNNIDSGLDSKLSPVSVPLTSNKAANLPAIAPMDLPLADLPPVTRDSDVFSTEDSSD